MVNKSRAIKTLCHDSARSRVRRFLSPPGQDFPLRPVAFVRTPHKGTPFTRKKYVYGKGLTSFAALVCPVPPHYTVNAESAKYAFVTYQNDRSTDLFYFYKFTGKVFLKYYETLLGCIKNACNYLLNFC